MKTITSYDFNVTYSNPQDRKLKYEFGKEINFDNKHIGRKNNKDRSLKTLPKSPAIMVFGNSTAFSSENANELCERLNLLLQEKQAGNNVNIIDEEVVAIADKL